VWRLLFNDEDTWRLAGESAQLPDQITILSRILTLTHDEQRVAAAFDRVQPFVGISGYADPKTGATQSTGPNPSIATLVIDYENVRQRCGSPIFICESTFWLNCAHTLVIDIHKTTCPGPGLSTVRK
jgi:hypothetical protein